MADSNRSLHAWSCNICLEECRDPVCTSCGHLFCWPCLYPWVHDMAKPCPVCRYPLTLHDSIIPVYVTTQAESAPQAAAAIAIPPRPQPRAPTTSTSAPNDDYSHAIRLYRETMNLVRRQEHIERVRLTGEEQHIAQVQHVIDADAQSLARLRRQLKDLRIRRMIRALAASLAIARSGTTTGQAASTRSLALRHSVSDMDIDIDRAHGTEVILHVVTAILGRLR